METILTTDKDIHKLYGAKKGSLVYVFCDLICDELLYQLDIRELEMEVFYDYQDLMDTLVNKRLF